jgi:hypothetical protein
MGGIRAKSKGKKATKRKLTARRKTLRNGKCSKGQFRTAVLFSQVLGGEKYEMEVTWDWLTTKQHVNMYLDIFFPEYNLAVEYHGEQHFKFPNFFHKTKDAFKASQKRDNLKSKLLKENNIKYIEWKFNEGFNDKRAIEKLRGVGIERRKNTKPLVFRTQKSSKITKIRPRRKL